MIDVKELINQAVSLLLIYVPKLVLALLVLFVGFYIIKVIGKSLKKVMKKKDVDRSLQSFIVTLVSVALKVMLVLSVMSMAGIEVASFIMITGMLGLAVGMALQGTLQNFAGGVIILLFRPFKTGDFIETQGYTGTVDEIQIFVTKLKTLDNRVVILPNSPVATSSLVNYTVAGIRRIDFTFGVSYKDDIDKVRKIALEVLKTETKIMKDKELFVGVKELADSSVNFAVRPWVKVEDYWDVYFSVTEKMKKAFDKEDISIPFPQTDVHIYQTDKA